MHVNIRIAALIAVSAAVILSGRMVVCGSAEPQRASSQAQGVAGTGSATADFPRGAEQIYMIKCWMRHNELAKTGPPLKDISKRPKLLSGPPVNDKTVSEVIRTGSPRMPS